jgi:N-hydroxyarylamine O-acetyltransferase
MVHTVNTTDSHAYLAYLERLHFTLPASSDARNAFERLEPSARLLRDLHERHLLSVPFENLSIHYHEPIVLETEALYHKIVSRHRGGFCYELNGLFSWLLTGLGYQVTLLSARVAEGEGMFSPDFDHLTLAVHGLEGSTFLADVGFGDSFRYPLRLEHQVEQAGGDGKTYRLIHSRLAPDEPGAQPVDYWTLECLREDGAWESQYRFSPEEHPLSDFTARCHYHQMSPESHFTQKRICSLALPAGRTSLSDLRLITTVDGTRAERLLQSEEEYRLVLADQFGISIESTRGTPDQHSEPYRGIISD